MHSTPNRPPDHRKPVRNVRAYLHAGKRLRRMWLRLALLITVLCLVIAFLLFERAPSISIVALIVPCLLFFALGVDWLSDYMSGAVYYSRLEHSRDAKTQRKVRHAAKKRGETEAQIWARLQAGKARIGDDGEILFEEVPQQSRSRR